MKSVGRVFRPNRRFERHPDLRNPGILSLHTERVYFRGSSSPHPHILSTMGLSTQVAHEGSFLTCSWTRLSPSCQSDKAEDPVTVKEEGHP